MLDADDRVGRKMAAATNKMGRHRIHGPPPDTED